MDTEFNGRSQHTIDAKGRVFIPQYYRDILGENFAISLSEDMKTLSFYPAEVWEVISRKLRSIPSTDRRAHQYTRRVFGSTFTNYNSDNQGRVLIPQAIREKYALNEGKDVYLVGVGTNLEIWNSDKFAEVDGAITEEETDEMLDYIDNKYFNAAPNGAESEE